MIDWPIGLSTGCFYQRGGRVLRELAQARFGGTLVLEISPRESLEATLQGAMQAWLFLRHLLRTVTP